MAGDDLGLDLPRREHARRLAHGTVLAVERPQDELARSRGREPLAADGEIERAHARTVTRHAHVLAIGEPPAVQCRLLHGGDHEAPVGAHHGGEMGALPRQSFRFALRIGEPQRDAVVMGNRKAQALRPEGQTADRRRQRERALGASAGAHECVSPRRPRQGARGTDCHVIDPTTVGVCANRGAVSLRVSCHHLAVVTTGDDT